MVSTLLAASALTSSFPSVSGLGELLGDGVCVGVS